MDIPEKIWHLIARTLNGEATAQDHQELMEALDRDENLRQQFDLLTRIWAEKQGNLQEQNNEAARNSISRILDRAEAEGQQLEMPASTYRLRHRRNRLALAASLAIIIMSAGGWFALNRFSQKNTRKQEASIEARRGSRSKTQLPDGSTVWLNAGSKLFLVGDLSGNTREVRLEGEAFFDVTRQPKRPFIVHTSGIDIKVLGTAFNVKSYPEDKTVETTLYRGSVKVFREEDSEKKAILLKPNEKLILSKKAAPEPANLPEDSKPSQRVTPASFTIAHIDSTKKENERVETAWLYSRLEFHGDNFEELAKKLERWYNVRIIFADEKVKDLSFDGSFESETVDQAFKYLKEANSTFNYKMNGNEIFVGSAQ